MSANCLSQQPVQYNLVRSKRKYLALQITRDATLVVRAPLKMAASDIERFIKLKQAWIRKHTERQLKRKPKVREFKAGETFPFLGKEYPLEIADTYSSKLSFRASPLERTRLGQDGSFVFMLSKFQRQFAKKKFEDWYRDRAKIILSQKCRRFASTMGVEYKKITITGAETRWGSCSSRGTVNFSWKLVMAPEAIVDYVVIHELAHLKHHNHSRAFWDFVEKHDPECKEHRNWLFEHEHLYHL